MRRTAFLLLICLGAGPSTQPAIRLKPGAPAAMADVLVKSEEIKKADRVELPKVIREARIEFARRRSGLVYGENFVQFPGDLQHEAYYFATSDDKKKSMAEQQAVIDSLVKTLSDAKDRLAIIPPEATADSLKVGFIGKVPVMKIEQITGDKTMLVQLFPATDVRSTSYNPDAGVDAIVSGFDTSNLTDDSLVRGGDATFWIAGTTRYTTVLGATRTVLDVRPCNIDDWVDR